VVRIVSGGEDAGWADWVSWLVSIPPGSGGCHRVYPKRVEGATLSKQLPPTPLRSGWGLTQSTGWRIA